MSLQSERIQLLMQRLSLTEMVHGYESLAEQAAQKNLPYSTRSQALKRCHLLGNALGPDSQAVGVPCNQPFAP